jgi:hypothetical protein
MESKMTDPIHEPRSASPPTSAWNSLEIAKLLVGALTPIAIFVFTYWTNQSQTLETEALTTQRQAEESKRQSDDKAQAQANERFAQVVKYRAELWSSISPQMNDLYCYFLYVGHWKDLDPTEILKTKRSLDKLVYSNSPFFSPDFLIKYMLLWPKHSLREMGGVPTQS